jgi:hypothetical protein
MAFKNRLALTNLTQRESSLEEIPQENQLQYLGVGG